MKKRIWFTVIITVVVLVAIVTVVSTQIALSKERARIAELEAYRDSLLLENERLTHDLSEDITDAYIIRIMRKLGYYFPGEKQITFVDTPTTEENE